MKKVKESTRKVNITIPLDKATIDKINTTTKELGTRRCNFIRHMIEFASRSDDFYLTMNKLYGTSHTTQ
jgi:hypothetical protein